jgi:hypothetical protein
LNLKLIGLAAFFGFDFNAHDACAGASEAGTFIGNCARALFDELNRDIEPMISERRLRQNAATRFSINQMASMSKQLGTPGMGQDNIMH